MRNLIITLFFIFNQFMIFGQVPTNQSNKVDGLRPIKPSQSAPNIFTPNVMGGKDKKPKTPMIKNCTCNPHGFNPFEYTYAGGEVMIVGNGHQFQVDCNVSLMLKGGYKCNYNTPCDVQLKATIKKNDPSNQLIMSYDNFNFPWHHTFEIAGYYVLEITPHCGGIACEPVKFFFDVKCIKPEVCKCKGKDGWQPFFAHIDGKSDKTTCGSNFEINLKQAFALEGGYQCEGKCNVVLKGTISNSTTGEEQSFDHVNLSGNINFPSAGDYKLILRPTCAKDVCDVCIFYVTVKK